MLPAIYKRVVTRTALGRAFHAATGVQNDQVGEAITDFNRELRDVFGGGATDGAMSAQAAGEGPCGAAPVGRVADSGAQPRLVEQEAQQLTHVDASGAASMVDVGGKQPTARAARATATVLLGELAFAAVRDNAVQKGDVLAAARLAGIMAAKRTASLIPLCHPLALDRVRVDFQPKPEAAAYGISAEAACTGRTGVEMEALTAAAVAALTMYDMCKALSKRIEITDLRLEHKRGGKSGDWERDACGAARA